VGGGGAQSTKKFCDRLLGRAIKLGGTGGGHRGKMQSRWDEERGFESFILAFGKFT